MIELYDSNDVVGIVDQNYEFNLRVQIYPIISEF